MRFGPALLLAAALAGQSPALAEEADPSDPLARSPGVSLRDLIPTAIVEGVQNPFGIQAEARSNSADAPIEIGFDITMPAYPNVSITLLVSERETVTRIVNRVLAMADDGNLPGGSPADADVLEGARCVGVVDQNTINCMIGSAGIQFSATDYLGGNSIDYAATKTLFQTLPLDTYRRVFGS